MQAFYIAAHERGNQIFRNSAQAESAQHDGRSGGDVGDGLQGTSNDLVQACFLARAAKASAAFETLVRLSTCMMPRPAAASFSRSMPVSTPIPFNIYTTSSVATLPLAPSA